MIAQANRGRTLERLIEMSNAAYRQRGLAVVQKVAVPTKVLPGRSGPKVVREKSTVDFVGVVAPTGRMVAFDAKENRVPTRFQFDRRWAHEVEFIRSVIQAGGLGFFLIEQVSEVAVYLLPGQVLVELWDAAMRGGRMSVPLAVLRTCPVVPHAPGVPIDWLAVI